MERRCRDARDVLTRARRVRGKDAAERAVRRGRLRARGNDGQKAEEKRGERPLSHAPAV
jgi:hypothetical protein